MKIKSYLNIFSLTALAVLCALLICRHTQGLAPALILLVWAAVVGLFVHFLNRQHRSELAAALALQKASISALVDLAQMRDYDVTGSHLHRLGYYADILGTDLNLAPETKENIIKTIALHDIGKVGVPDKILNKPGPPLDAEEWDIIKKTSPPGGCHGSRFHHQRSDRYQCGNGCLSQYR